jgi:hypothetical protein
LTRRANHLHIVIVARITARGQETGSGLFVCRKLFESDGRVIRGRNILSRLAAFAAQGPIPNSEAKFKMAKAPSEIHSIARSHTRSAINVLVGIMPREDATAAARVSATIAILDRGWGKAVQPIEGGDGGPLQLIHRIEHVIVHPENSDR